VLSLALALSWPHGGQYRGPGAVAPPAPAGSATGSRLPGTPDGNTGSTAPGSPSGGAAVTPGPAAGGGQLRPGRLVGTAIDEDLGRWEFWWEFGKDPLLRLRDAVYAPSRQPEDDLLVRRGALVRAAAPRPTPADLDAIAAALVATLRRTNNRDVASACLVALAKIGRDAPGATFLDLCIPFLARNDQELRETAALALGIAGDLEARRLDILRHLVADDSVGRNLSGGTAVNDRTRAFAAFALGLLLARADDAATATAITEPLAAVLRSPGQHSRELKVAAVEALGLFPRSLPGPAARMLRHQTLRLLGDYYAGEAGAGERLIQAHVPPAIARILPHDDPWAGTWRDRFAADLGAAEGRDESARGANLHIAQSCALALGELGDPWTGENAIADLLLAASSRHRDPQTRAFALLALSRLGGQRTRAALLQQFRDARSHELPWCAMALGVYAARQRTIDPAPDEELAATLRAAFEAARNPSTLGALALALGLSGDPEVVMLLQRALGAYQHRDDVVGYVALALGLLGDLRAAPDLRALLAGAQRRPFVVMQCARALGLLGDPHAVALLCAELSAADGSLVRLAAAASALGALGDRRSIEPLLRRLEVGTAGSLTVAFAAVALGSLGDKDPLPWNHVYATNTNYRAATSTLTNGQSGILDIL
jgi:HEAT repeat protein